MRPVYPRRCTASFGVGDMPKMSQFGQSYPMVKQSTTCENTVMKGAPTHVGGDRSMFRLPQAQAPARLRRGWRSALVAGLAGFLSACGGAMPSMDVFGNSPSSPPAAAEHDPQPAIGAGQIKVGLLLPLSASGNAGAAG